MEEKEKFLEVKNLTIDFTSAGSVVHAVNDVSFTLDRGKVLGLIGETGAGKSVVAKAILQILPDHGTKIRGGEILFEGKDLMKLKEDQLMKIRGNAISMIFQDPMTALNPIMRIGTQITEVITHHKKISKADAEKEAMAMLEKVGIPSERFREYPHQFSGGMKQRVVCAMALACNPVLLLADEPTTALDVTIQAQVLKMISDLRKELNASMLIITHDIGVVSKVCDDIAIMYAGQIIEKGSKKQIFSNPSHPYTQGLFAALPSMNEDVEFLHPIEGLPPDPANLPKGCPFAPRCPRATDECRMDKPIPVTMVEEGHTTKCLRYKEART